MSTATTTADVREHLAQIDISEFAATLIPERFRDVDYANLNGIEGIGDLDNPHEWDFVRFAEDAASA